MVGVQGLSARIGAVTGQGLARNLRRHYPASLACVATLMLLVANVINIGADLAAMGAALRLLAGGPQLVYAVLFGIVCVLLEIFVRYRRYATFLKWLADAFTLCLCRGRLRRRCSLDGGGAWRFHSFVLLRRRAGHGVRRCAGNDDQPLSALLAAGPGSGRALTAASPEIGRQTAGREAVARAH